MGEDGEKINYNGKFIFSQIIELVIWPWFSCKKSHIAGRCETSGLGFNLVNACTPDVLPIYFHQKQRT